MQETKGQSIVEVVVAIGVVGLVLSGAVILLVRTLGVRGRTYERKKAVELGTAVMEDLVSIQKNSPDSFWLLQNIPPGTLLDNPPGIRSGFDGYVYSVGFTNITGTGNCGVGTTNCAQVTVRVGWTSEVANQIEFSKFMFR